MAFAHYLFAVPMDTSIHPKISIPPSFCSTESPSSLPFPSFSSPFPPLSKARNLSIFPRINRVGHKEKAEPRESEVNIEADAFSHFKHLLLPITDRNPYLSEGTRQAAATTAALAKKNGAEITVVVVILSNLMTSGSNVPKQARKKALDLAYLVFAATLRNWSVHSAGVEFQQPQPFLDTIIDEKQKESLPEHETQLASVRWHLSESGFKEFKLLERLGEGSKPTAIIGEVADDLNLDLVVMSMEAIHSKHVDANLLAEFIPCPVLLLPL
ncbi:hypothetical protein Gotri_023519 [Gossypium trilobum]|uniref:Uncharacterized protein n=1 Tax=Gossypium trilobum TaxID=34281 RepID=A0A7J9DJG5_9ROSI|nr:hypothetical protein [Gossypium trilobum]